MKKAILSCSTILSMLLVLSACGGGVMDEPMLGHGGEIGADRGGDTGADMGGDTGGDMGGDTGG